MTTPLRDEIEFKLVRIQAGILAAVMGIVAGLGLFAMTIWLVVKGGPAPGPHLSLLGQYFPGYSVTWLGAVVGLGYGLISGAVSGWVIGLIYNLIVTRRHGPAA